MESKSPINFGLALSISRDSFWASDRRSDLMMGRSQNPHGKYTRPQVETVDDLDWGSTPIAYLLAEEKGEGFWRLQTEDAHLKERMNPRVWNARSPWHLTGRSSTTCIYRRWFCSTSRTNRTPFLTFGL